MCPKCGKPMQVLFTSWFCPACDAKNAGTADKDNTINFHGPTVIQAAGPDLELESKFAEYVFQQVAADKAADSPLDEDQLVSKWMFRMYDGGRRVLHFRDEMSDRSIYIQFS